MKKVTIIICFILVAMLCVGCVSQSVFDQVKNENDTLKAENEELQTQVDHLEYMVEVLSTPAPTEAPPIEATEALKDIEIKIYDPNSADGVDVFVSAYNSSERTIKYIDFVVTPYNAVGDEVKCEIRDRGKVRLSLTGPEEPNSEMYGMWDTVWYNSTIVTCKLNEIVIEYMDGSILEISDSALDVIGVTYEHGEKKFW